MKEKSLVFYSERLHENPDFWPLLKFMNWLPVLTTGFPQQHKSVVTNRKLFWESFILENSRMRN